MADETVNEGGEPSEEVIPKSQVESIVKERLAQQAKNKFGDYADLKARAEGAKTLEERLKSVEDELNTTKLSALRSSVAARFGISTDAKKGEKSDADLFLTATDEETLVAQAKRLADRVSERKKHGNIAPGEGDTKQTNKADGDLREFTRQLFHRD